MFAISITNCVNAVTFVRCKLCTPLYALCSMHWCTPVCELWASSALIDQIVGWALPSFDQIWPHRPPPRCHNLVNHITYTDQKARRSRGQVLNKLSSRLVSHLRMSLNIISEWVNQVTHVTQVKLPQGDRGGASRADQYRWPEGCSLSGSWILVSLLLGLSLVQSNTMWGHKTIFITNSMMLVANRCILPEGALKCSDGRGRSGDVENARLNHSTFAVWRPAIQDPVILTEFIHKTCFRHYVCFELICLICVSCFKDICSFCFCFNYVCISVFLFWLSIMSVHFFSVFIMSA